jgi:hypothetical protein
MKPFAIKTQGAFFKILNSIHMNNRSKYSLAIAAFALSIFSGCSTQKTARTETRSEVSYLRGRYNTALFRRHFESETYSAGFHFHHGMQHDLLQLTPLSDRDKVDADFDAKVYKYVKNKKVRVGPSMEYFGPYVSRMAWKLYRTIDWTHEHHEQTYDILSFKGISWKEKKEWTDRAVKYYLDKNPEIAFSIAPLDITMRRVAAMMKPYFTYYRNYYPKSNSEAWVAHWWHPVIYESMMVAGNDKEQEEAIKKTNETMFNEVFQDRPQRMLLGREIMPRYAKMTPESANIFDNLHMLHGIAFDILAYEGWSEQQKREELYRVIDALSYKPGDEKYVRKFTTPHPDMDPREYEAWMKGSEGEMNRIMTEMMVEMMPMMMPHKMTADMKEKMMAQFKMKMRPGMEQGEIEGSLHDAMVKMMPDMKMMPDAMEPGKTPKMMVDAMLKGWEEKYASMPDIEGWNMEQEPVLSSIK